MITAENVSILTLLAKPVGFFEIFLLFKKFHPEPSALTSRGEGYNEVPRPEPPVRKMVAARDSGRFLCQKDSTRKIGG